MLRTFHNLSWVCVGSDEDNNVPADDDDTLTTINEGDWDRFVVKWKNLRMQKAIPCDLLCDGEIVVLQVGILVQM